MDTVHSIRKGQARRAPNIENRKVTAPGTRHRKTNKELRPREYLTPAEVERLMAAAGKVGRHGHRDATLLLLAYRHALRVSELVSLLWDAVDLKAGQLHVARLKNGLPSVHPLRGPELRALRRLQREQQDAYGGTFVFTSERGGPMTADNVRKLVARAGELAGMQWPVHPHQLRHGCGFYLANAGHDTRAIQQYMGHANIQHTTRYTELLPNRFKDFWRD